MARKVASGPVIPVNVITSSDIEENGGKYKLSGKVAIPVHGYPEASPGGPAGKVQGGARVAVYVVSADEVASGEYSIQGGSSQPVTEFAPATLRNQDDFIAIPVYVVSGTLGSGATPAISYFDFDAASVTFTPGMGQRAAPGPFDYAPIVQGDLDVSGGVDTITYARGTQIIGTFYNNWDASQGSISLWITPEWDGNDGLQHFLFAVSSTWALTKRTSDVIGFYSGATGWVDGPSTAAWTAGTTYHVVFSWDTKNSIDGTNYVRISVNDSHAFGGTSGPTIVNNTPQYIGALGTQSANAIIEGFTLYRRVLYDGTYGVDVGNGDEIAAIYASGSGKDPAEVTGSWDVVFALPTDQDGGAIATGTGHAWTHPYASNVPEDWHAMTAFASSGWFADYLLSANFNAADQGFTNGQELDTTGEGVQAGQLTAVEADGTLAISSNKLTFTAQSTPAWADLGAYSDAITRALGLTLLGTVNASATNKSGPALSWIDVQSTDIGNGVNERWLVYFESDGLVKLGQSTLGVFPIGVSYSAATDYPIAIVLGGFDSNGAPWYSGAAGTFTYGASMFIKIGATWSLLYSSALVNTATMYVAISNLTDTGTVDNLRVPDADLSAVLQPLAADTFTDTNGTLITAHTMDVGAGWGYLDTYTDTIDIQSNVAKRTGTTDRPIAVIDVGDADIFLTCQLTIGTYDTTARAAGVSFRATDEDNRWDFYVFADSNSASRGMYLDEIVATTQTTRASAAPVDSAGATTYRMSVRAGSTDIRAWRDGANALQYTGSAHQSVTKHGFWPGTTASPDYTIDSWACYALESGTFAAQFDDPRYQGKSSGAQKYLLQASFDASDQGYSNGQVVNTTAEGIETGNLTIVEVDGTLAISSNELAITGQSSPVWGDLGAYSDALTRALGLTLLTTIRSTTDTNAGPIVQLSTTQDPDPSATNRYFVGSAGNDNVLSIAEVGGGGLSIGTYAAATNYPVAIVLGGFDSNGQPWYSGAAGTYTYGAAMFIKVGGTWELLYRSASDATATMYAEFASYTAAGAVDNLRVPDADLSAVLAPLAADTFTDTNGVLLTAHTMDVGAGWSVGQEGANNLEIQGNTMRDDDASDDRAYANIDVSDADVFITAQVSFSAGSGSNAGLVARYVDTNNHWLLFTDTLGDNLDLFERTTGTYTKRATASVTFGASTYRLSMRLDSTDIRAWADGANALQYTSSSHQTETSHGARVATAPGDTPSLDNWACYALESATFATEFDAY